MAATIQNTTGTNDGFQQFGDTVYTIGLDVVVNTERNDPQTLITEITGVYQDRFHVPETA